MSKSGKGPWRAREGQRRTIGTGDRVFRAGFPGAGVKQLRGGMPLRHKYMEVEKVPPRSP